MGAEGLRPPWVPGWEGSVFPRGHMRRGCAVCVVWGGGGEGKRNLAAVACEGWRQSLWRPSKG